VRREILRRKANKSAIPRLSDDLPNRKESNINMEVKFGGPVEIALFSKEI
jgi:hypothetical protein